MRSHAGRAASGAAVARVAAACAWLLAGAVGACVAPNPAYDPSSRPDVGHAPSDGGADQAHAADVIPDAVMNEVSVNVPPVGDADPADRDLGTPEAAAETGPDLTDARDAALDAASAESGITDRPPDVADVPAADAMEPISCANAAACPLGLPCTRGVCQPTEGLILHWRFDEMTGAEVRDSSTTQFHGTAVGTGGGPAPSTMVPNLKFSDPQSRTFDPAQQDGVHGLVPMPAALKLSNNLTLSAWYRTKTVDSSSMANGSEIVSLGNNLVLRLRADQLEFGKQAGPAGSEFLKCFADITNHLDGKWHHIAAVTAAAAPGMRIYFDGVQVCSNGITDDIRYVEGNDLWVGRHAALARNRFDGNIDDLRIYKRALSSSEIAALAAGGQ
jgi:hypothetical protein